MISFFLHAIRDFLLPYGAWGVFFAEIIEEVIAPIPSALVLLAAGFFLIPPDIFFIEALRPLILVVAVPGALGMVLGSLLVYLIAYVGGKLILQKWGGYLGISWAEVEKFEQNFAGGYLDEIALFIARALPVIPSVAISAFCGLVRMPLREYLIYSFLGSMVRAFILGFIGWRAGSVYESAAVYFDAAEKFIFAFLIFAVIIFWAYKTKHKNHKIKIN